MPFCIKIRAENIFRITTVKITLLSLSISLPPPPLNLKSFVSLSPPSPLILLCLSSLLIPFPCYQICHITALVISLPLSSPFDL